jgi:hypothetical protein
MWHAYVDSHVGSGDENELETRVGDESGPFKSSRTKLTQSQELGDETGYFADLIYPTFYQSNTLFAWLISHQPAVLFSQNKPTTSNQPTVFFSQNKPAPAISHQPNEHETQEHVRFLLSSWSDLHETQEHVVFLLSP